MKLAFWLLILIPFCAFSAELESGAVQRSDSLHFHRNTIPQVARFGDGNIDQSVFAARRGFLVSKVELLERVSKGQEIGFLLDLHGEVAERFTAPSDGVVGLIHACPRVDNGEPLFLITGVAG